MQSLPDFIFKMKYEILKKHLCPVSFAAIWVKNEQTDKIFYQVTSLSHTNFRGSAVHCGRGGFIKYVRHSGRCFNHVVPSNRHDHPAY